MSAGVFTPESRLTFVEKTIGEVGGLTPFPMLVTLDQLAEIRYRVKDAWFTAGAVPSEGDPATIAGTPPAEFASVYDAAGISSTIRGYCVMDGSTGNLGDFFEGTVGAAAGDFREEYFGSAYNLALYGDFYDITADERGMWHHRVPGGATEGEWNACAFNHWLLTDSGADPGGGVYGCWASDPAGTIVEILVELSGEVAWVGGSSHLDPACSLYLGLRVRIDVHYGESFATDDTYGTDAADFDFKIKLSGATPLSCPLYSGGTEPSGGSDFILEAKEWWPYAKNSPPTPVWNSTTGIKL
jgi:hypothetical protein